MKNYQIISYNCNPDKFNQYNYEKVLYLFHLPEKQVQCKYYTFIDHSNLEIEIIEYLKQYYKKLDEILFLDNKKPIKINTNNLKEYVLISGKIKQSEYKDCLIAKTYELHGLTINCKNLNENHISDMYPRKIGDVYFPPFSYFMHRQYKFCEFEINSGIIENPF